MPDLARTLDSWAAKRSGRAWWRARFRDGRIVHEAQCDWLELPRKGLIALQLMCPNGEVAELGNTADASDRLFQFKCARMGAPIRTDDGPGLSGPLRTTDAQVIGLITGTDGACVCAAWETGPRKLVTFEDNVFFMRYAGVGQLHGSHLGIKPD